MIQKTLTCDSCFDTAEHGDGIVLARSAPAARKQAKDYAGWHRSKNRDICEACWAEGDR